MFESTVPPQADPRPTAATTRATAPPHDPQDFAPIRPRRPGARERDRERRLRRAGERNRLTRRLRKKRFGPEINAQLKMLTKQTSDLDGLSAISTDFALIGGAIALSTVYPMLYPLSALVIGTRMRGLATILHEGSHLTLCRRRWLSKAIGALSGWCIFQTFAAYKASHVEEHHPHLGDPDRDPDLINYTNQGLFTTPPGQLFRRHLLPLALGLKSWTNMRNLIKDRLVPKDWKAQTRGAKLEFIGFLAFWATLLGGMTWAGLLGPFLLFWILPYLTVFQAVNWLIELSEHFPLIRLFENELYVTRNRRGGRVENFFTGIHGENWHLVHHVHPGIPFAKLNQAHEIMMQDEDYAKANAGSGGLFFKGPKGEPSILSMMSKQLQASQTMEGRF